MGPRQLAGREVLKSANGRRAGLGLARRFPSSALIPRILEVTNRSMEPTLRAGDRVVVSRLLRPRTGRLVVFRDDESGHHMVKRVAEPPPGTVLAPDELWLLADNADEPTARDSRHWGPVKRRAVFGVALFRCWPPGRAGSLR